MLASGFNLTKPLEVWMDGCLHNGDTVSITARNRQLSRWTARNDPAVNGLGTLTPSLAAISYYTPTVTKQVFATLPACLLSSTLNAQVASPS